MSSIGLKRKLELAATTREVEDETSIAGSSNLDSDTDGSGIVDSDDLPSPPKRRRTVPRAKPSTLLNAYTRTQLQRLLESQGEKAMWQHLFCDQLPDIMKRVNHANGTSTAVDKTKAVVEAMHETHGYVHNIVLDIQDTAEGTYHLVTKTHETVHDVRVAALGTLSGVQNLAGVLDDMRSATKSVSRQVGDIKQHQNAQEESMRLLLRICEGGLAKQTASANSLAAQVTHLTRLVENSNRSIENLTARIVSLEAQHEADRSLYVC